MKIEPEEIRDSRIGSPFDPRVLSLDKRAPVIIFLAGFFQVSALGGQILQAIALGQIVASVITKHYSVYQERHELELAVAASIIVIVSHFVQDRVLAKIAGRIKASIRIALIAKAAERGSHNLSSAQTSTAMLLATKGLGDVESYLIRFLPSAIYALVAPLVLVIYTTYLNTMAGITEIATIAAIPPLMIVLGRTAGSKADQKWRSLQLLSSHFVESISAIPTLKGIGATKQQEIQIGDATRRLERDTMSTLYLAFLSTGVLEAITTLAIALVAVEIGLRLANHAIALAPSVTVLILAPLLYLAIRSASTQFHTTTDARVAMDAIFDELAQASSSLKPTRTNTAPITTGQDRLVVRGLAHLLAGSGGSRLDFERSSGSSLAIVGKSGSGKTTLLRHLCGLEIPSSGSIRFNQSELCTLSSVELAKVVSYLPQSPTLFQASILENILVGRALPAKGRLAEVLAIAQLSDLLSSLPGGLQYMVSEFGQSLSAGQRQRIAIARILLKPTPILILDEPTSFLDQTTESRLWNQLRNASKDCILIFATHRSYLADSASDVLELSSSGAELKLSGGSRRE